MAFVVGCAIFTTGAWLSNGYPPIIWRWRRCENVACDMAVTLLRSEPDRWTIGHYGEVAHPSSLRVTQYGGLPEIKLRTDDRQRLLLAYQDWLDRHFRMESDAATVRIADTALQALRDGRT